MTRNELKNKENYTFEDLVEIMNILRGENGCPWDREQTHESIRKNFIEETYEVIEAIDTKDSHLMCEELGDVMLQVVFHSKMSEEAGEFSINNVLDGICRKLIHRHPHLFGDAEGKTAEQVLNNWEAIKREEKGRKTLADNLSQVCTSLPALMRAEKLISKTRKMGKEILSPEIDTTPEMQLGKELFELCKKADDLHIDAEEALSKYCNAYVSTANKDQK